MKKNRKLTKTKPTVINTNIKDKKHKKTEKTKTQRKQETVLTHKVLLNQKHEDYFDSFL